ncbi:MAG: PepSY-like domain-containing protein, partial [Capnocytophaga sp.]|nr:PepSY-like domain-containing protein [Capnocytophaga sp.]
MKKYIFLSLAALSLASCASLPTPAKDFVSKHFPATPVVNVEREDDFRGYSAELSDRTEIEFTKEGDWIQVDAEDGNMLPATFFPENIA